MGVISLDLQQTDAGYDVEKEIKRLDQEIDDEVAARVAADTSIWEEIETIEAASDVVDVVGTHAALESYDTSKLQDNDIIKVLQDETRDDAITYYRWNEANSTFVYVGAEGPYYTASEVDTLLGGKQDTLIAGSNITIAADGKTISATDTTYTHFTGATASEDGAQGLVPAPVAGDEDKVLKGDGTWGTASPNYSAGTGIDITNNTISIDNTVATQTDLASKQDTLTAGTNITISGTTISAADTTYSDFTGASSLADGANGLVPAPLIGDEDKYLKGDGTWATVQGGSSSPTIIYIDDDIEDALPAAGGHIYSDSSKQNIMTWSDVQALFGTAAGHPEDVYLYIADSSDAMYRVVSCYEGDDNFTVVRYNPSHDKLDVFDIDRTYRDPTQSLFTASQFSVQPKLVAGSNVTISGSTISARDTTYSTFGGATSSTAGVSGLVPAPAAGDEGKFLKGDGTWTTVSSGSSYTAGNGIDIDSNNEISVDTTVVATQTDLAGKQDTLTAGTNISISNNTISATDTTYSAGTGISIDANNAISAATNNINTTDWNTLWQ